MATNLQPRQEVKIYRTVDTDESSQRNASRDPRQASLIVNLPRGRLRWAYAVVAFLAASVFCAKAVCVLLTSEYAASMNPVLWRRATRLEPDNAAYWAKLGMMEEWDLERGDLGQGATDYEKAVKANPHSDRYWLELAGIYERRGETSKARGAYEEAKHNHPISPELARRYGTFLLRQGDARQAHAQFQRALLVDPGLTEGVVEECWKTGHGVSHEITECLPPQNNYYFRALDYFRARNEIDAALEMWAGLLTLGQHFELRQALPFINDLMSSNRTIDAQRLWREALKISEWPQDKDGQQVLVFNGSFELELANGGFDWREEMLSGVSFGFDSISPHSGTRSLRISFDGSTNLDFEHLFQYVAAKPAQEYRFTAYLKSSSLSTDSGIEFMIIDAFQPAHFQVFTPSVRGTQPWTRIETKFTTSADSHLVKIVLRRIPSSKFDNKLQGTVWVDDVSLVALAASNRARD